MKLEAIGTLKSIPFMIMLVGGIALVVGNTFDSDWLGAPYPVTREMVDVIRSAFAVFALLIAAFYAGDIVWRERTLKLDEVTDAMPVPTWLQWTAKFTSLLLVILSTVVLAILEGPASGAIAGELGPAVDGRHLQLYSVHREEQRFFERIGATGGSYGGGLSMSLAALNDRKMERDGIAPPFTEEAESRAADAPEGRPERPADPAEGFLHWLNGKASLF